MQVQNSQTSGVKDVWAAGHAYEPYVGRWSRLVALQFLSWLAVPPAQTWLDAGCGTGALSRTILEAAAPRFLLGIDSAKGFITYARRSVPGRTATFSVADARALPVASGTHDLAVSGLVLNFVPQPENMLSEMARIVNPGGLVAIYVWDYSGSMQFLQHFWNAAAVLDPSAAGLDEARRFPLCNPDPLTHLFHSAGLKQIEVRPLDIQTRFKDFDDYWLPFLGGQGPAPSYAMALNESSRARLREQIRSKLPFASDGSIPLVARAWAVRGVR
jgi:SAM-dependent methyltransferase